MKNGKEIRPNGQIILKGVHPHGYTVYAVEGDQEGMPWAYLRTARKRADSLPRREPEADLEPCYTHGESRLKGYCNACAEGELKDNQI